MTDYTIYDVATGEVVTMGSAPDPTIYPLKENERMIVGRLVNRHEQRVSADGRVIKKRGADIEARELVEAWRVLRNQRAYLLAASDWTQFPDSPADPEVWQAYRQALRDLPKNTKDPRNPEWPEKPQ